MTFNFEVLTPVGPHQFSISSGSSLIFVGANGGGKSRLAVQIERTNPTYVHRISAHRSLALNPAAPKISERLAKRGLKYGYASEDSAVHYKGGHRWGNEKWATHLLVDFDFVIQGLFAEQSNTALVTHNACHVGSNDVPKNTKFQVLISIWQRLLPHRELIVTGDDVNVRPTGTTDQYSASEMSDGERAIFYLIGQTLLADESTLLIIDEPELHVHRSIMSKLWDELEAARTDCAFVFITHDLEFAASRTAEKFVIRDYAPASGWTIEAVPDDTGFDEEIATLILGSRKPILFVEGSGTSLDIAIYRCCFPSATVIARGSCQDVIHSVATMRKNASLTRVTCAGIVDADSRNAEEVGMLTQIGISVLSVSEIENLILIPSVSRAILIAENYDAQDVEQRLTALKEAVFAKLGDQSDIEGVVLRHCRRQIDAALKKMDFSDAENVADLQSAYGTKTTIFDVTQIADGVRSSINTAIEQKDLEALLRIYDDKGLFALAALHLTGRSLRKFESWLTRTLGNNQASDLKLAVSEKLPEIIFS
jgi:ABC-type cobalamin/Fe3+-siderophores transport system ATPase subunit